MQSENSTIDLAINREEGSSSTEMSTPKAAAACLVLEPFDKASQLIPVLKAGTDYGNDEGGRELTCEMSPDSSGI